MILLILGDHIQSLKLVFDVDTKTRPAFLLEVRWNLRGVVRKVADMAVGRHHIIVLLQELGNGASLGGAFDDDEILR